MTFSYGVGSDPDAGMDGAGVRFLGFSALARAWVFSTKDWSGLGLTPPPCRAGFVCCLALFMSPPLRAVAKVVAVVVALVQNGFELSRFLLLPGLLLPFLLG